MVSTKKRDNTVGRIPSRDRQLHCRSGVTSPSVVSQVEAEQGSFSPHNQHNGPLQFGSVCNTPESPAQTVRQLETGTVCSSHRCPDTQLERQRSLCLPTILPDREMSAEGARGGGNVATHGTHMEYTAMVPSASRPADSSPSTVSVKSDLLTDPFNQSYPGNDLQLAAWRISGDNTQVCAYQKELPAFLQAGWSSGTNTAYQSAWSKWVSWCDRRKGVFPVR